MIAIMSTIKNLMPALLLLGVVLFALLVGHNVDIYYKRLAYTISVLIRSFIMTVLPLMIVGFVASALMMLKDKAIKYFGVMVLFVMVSNAFGVLFGQGFARLFVQNDIALCITSVSAEPLEPFFEVSSIDILTSVQALFLGLLLGICTTKWGNIVYNKTSVDLEKFIHYYQSIAMWIMHYAILPLIPFLVCGMAMKLCHQNDTYTIFNSYGRIFLYCIVAQLSYLLLLTLVATRFNLKEGTRLLHNVLPATLTGFSTLSSIATMPVTIACAEKVAKHKEVARLFIPATVNMHLVCSAISINVVSMALAQIYGLQWPNWWMTFFYIAQFVMIMLGATGVSGGLIFLLVPLLEQTFGFEAQVSALVVMLMMLYDPIDTASNVTANAMMTKIFEKFYSFSVLFKQHNVERGE
jgi:Na+/H+-dicarboxylate symporter